MTVPEASAFPPVITLFGPFSVLVGGQPIAHLRSRKAQWLLALLVLRHGRPVEREWLAGILWPDVEQTLAFANLRPILSELRKALGSECERLQSPNRHSLLLEMTGAEVDVVAFDKAIASKTLPTLKRAVALYRGPLLEGCSEEWVTQERSPREQACLAALKTLAEAASEAGDYEEATNHYRRATSLAPLWEVAWRGLMESLDKGGDRNAALQTYREFVGVLRANDSRAVPGEETTALYQRLRNEARRQASVSPTRNAEPTEPAVVGYLPHPLTDLVGREDERLEVAERLRRSRLVTLTGPGGIGKTRLADAVAHEVVRECPDGVWLVALDALSEDKQVVEQIAAALLVKEEKGRPLLQSLTDHLRGKQLLLVLDNCEHLLDASAHLASHLLQECAGVRILATSREVLGITGETAWAVPSLRVPERTHLTEGNIARLQPLMGYESVQLFVERAGAALKDFALTGENAQAVAEICSYLEGIPLAIELTAARVTTMTAEQIAARLHDHLGLLMGQGLKTATRQQTLRATLDWSYSLLSDEERLLLQRLSVFVGGWSLEAAEAVCAASAEGAEPEMAESQILDVLSGLTEKSLVTFEERDPETGGRYRLLEMVRQYAAERLQATDEATPLRNRHRDWCIALAEGAVKQIQGPDLPIALRRLETDRDNLRTALAWCEEDDQGAEVGLRLAGALWRFWSIRSYYSEGRKYLERALARDGAQARTRERADALRGAASLIIRQGDSVRARELDEEFLSIQRELGSQGGIATGLCNLGGLAFGRGDYAEAQRLCAESLVIFRELGLTRSIAWSLGSLGVVALAQGDDAAAETFFEESLSLCREFGEQQGIAYALHTLGDAVESRGDHTAARGMYEESLTLYQELGNKHGIASALMGLGSVACSLGDYEEASFQMGRGLTLFQESGDQESIALNLGGLAEVMSGKKDVKTAIRLWATAQYLRDSMDLPLPPVKQKDYDQQLEQARRSLGEDAFAAVWKEGYAPNEEMLALIIKQQGV